MREPASGKYRVHGRTTDHGSARWCTPDDLKGGGGGGFLNGNDGVTLGYVWAGTTVDGIPFSERVTYAGDQHIVTTAPNRTGKGATAIIPALLDYAGSMFCIDPKGENAYVTAKHRQRMFKQRVHILDPWGVTAPKIGQPTACYNPLAAIPSNSPTLNDDAELLADAIVTPTGGDEHWSREAKALIRGFLLHLLTDPTEHNRRHLPRLRQILNMHKQDMHALVKTRMLESPKRVVREAGQRFLGKNEKELSSIISTAQGNTHFIDSPQMGKSLSKSSFDFADLKAKDGSTATIYIVLPAQYLDTHSSWLRLLVSMALRALVADGPISKQPTLLVLDEFAAIGKLAMIEKAFGLMAGYGLQMWAILQDMSQLRRIYKESWATFIANAGVLQFFGTRDFDTAEYLSKLCGHETVEYVSQDTRERMKTPHWFWRDADPNARSVNDQTFGKPLITADEIMRMPADEQLLFLPQMFPLRCRKVPYYNNARFFRASDDTPRYNPLPQFGKKFDFVWYTLASYRRFKSEYARLGKTFTVERFPF